MIFGQTRFLKRWLRQFSCPAYCYNESACILACNTPYQDYYADQYKKIQGIPLTDIYPEETSDFLIQAQKNTSTQARHIKLKTVQGVQEHTLISTQHKGKAVMLVLINEQEIQTSTDSTLETIDIEYILSKLPACIYWEDRFGNILGCNDRLLSLMNLSQKEDILHQNSFSLGKTMGLSNEDALKIRKNTLQVMQENQTYTFEESLILRGKKHIFLSRKSPFILEDKCVGILGVSIEITDEKKQQEELKTALYAMETAYREKSHFIANISHDLRTPLHTLLATTELLQMKNHYPEQETHLSTMMECGHTLLRLIENVLNFSKLNDGKELSAEETFNLVEMIHSLIKTTAPLAEKKKLQLNVFIADNTPSMITANAHAISRIVINLLQNAIKFTEYGEIALSLDIEHDADDNAECILIVRDTGIGIDPLAQEHIFKRFFQMTPSWKSEEDRGSLGLGLAIVKQFIDLLGGTITLSSEPNVGTTFECRFPVSIADDEPEALIDPDKQPISLSHVRILLVEDSPLVQHVCTHTLENFGCQVSLAETGEQAIRMAKQLSLDIIFLDMGLPDMSGIEVAEQLKEINTPIVALTAHDDEELKEACKAAGVVDYITKPASYKALLKAIEMYVPAEEKTT